MSDLIQAEELLQEDFPAKISQRCWQKGWLGWRTKRVILGDC
jgi:hypothetical protein